MRTLSSGIYTAQKDYTCDGCMLLLNADMPEGVLSFSELKSFAYAKKDNFLIKKGSRYFKHVYLDNGVFNIFRVKLNIHIILENHHFYDND